MPVDEEVTHVIWQDPSMYDSMQHGPPYLPTMGGRIASVQQVVKQASSKHFAFLRSKLAGGLECYFRATLALMRAASLIHQTHHWQTRGQSYYGDHLLFERLYNDSQGMIDSLAERSVSLFGYHVVDANVQTAAIGEFVAHIYGTREEQLTGSESYPRVSLQAELLMLLLLKMVYEATNSEGKLSLGMDNLLQGVADNHEQFVYLLQQRIAACSGPVKQASMDPWKAWVK
jgi:hypothetical protein